MKPGRLAARLLVALVATLIACSCGYPIEGLMATYEPTLRQTVDTRVQTDVPTNLTVMARTQEPATQATLEARVQSAVRATLTLFAATQAADRPPATEPPATALPTVAPERVALVSFHGRYITAMGGEDGWLLRQQPEPSECAWFTLRHVDPAAITLETCHGRYVTAPMTGTTRWDWVLRQEAEPGDCARFTLHPLAGGETALETCAGKYVTAGDGGWESGLAWAVVAETTVIQDWEHLTMQP